MDEGFLPDLIKAKTEERWRKQSFGEKELLSQNGSEGTAVYLFLEPFPRREEGTWVSWNNWRIQAWPRPRGEAISENERLSKHHDFGVEEERAVVVGRDPRWVRVLQRHFGVFVP